MENVLIKLKKILNTFTDKELQEMDLYMDNSKTIKIIGIDKNDISLITEETEIKVNGFEW